MPSSEPPQPRYPFWHEVIVPTTRALEAFLWRALIGGVVLYVIVKKCCVPIPFVAPEEVEPPTTSCVVVPQHTVGRLGHPSDA